MPGYVIKLKRPYANGRPRYRATWRHRYERGIRFERVFANKETAERWIIKADADAEHGYVRPKQHRKMTFGQFVDVYKDTRLAACAPRTQTRYHSILKNYLLPAWGNRSLAAIDREQVKRYFGQLSHQCSPGQVHKVHIVASSVFSEAMDLEYVQKNPASGIKLPAIEDREMIALTAAEVRALAERIDPRYRCLIYTAAYSGCRASELYALCRRDVDLTARRLHVRRALKRSYGEGNPKDAPLFGVPKNGRADSVAVPAFVRDVLAAHIASIPGGPDQLVFTAPEGGLIRHELFRRRFYGPAVAATVAAGEIPQAKAGLRFHDLRHSTGALLAKQGATGPQIQQHLRHRDSRSTWRYTHFFEGHDDDLMAGLDADHAEADAKADAKAGRTAGHLRAV